MTPARLSTPGFFRIAVLTALLGLPAAHADDYTDVNQLLRTGKSAEALTRVNQFLAAKPRDPQMRFLKGVILTETGRAGEAITTFVKLTEDYPELPEPYNNLAVLYAGQSQFDKARAALEMAIRTNPSYATAHENLGDVYAKLASQAYSKALQLDGANTGVQPKLALIRELFSPDARSQRPAAAAPAPAVVAAAKPVTPPPAPAPAPAAVAAAPVPAPAAAPAPAPAKAAAAASAPAAAVPAPAAPAASTANKEVEAAVRRWASAWAAKDMAGYLGAYGREFDPPGTLDRKAWEEERRARIVGKTRISVSVDALTVSVNGDRATARFRQGYSADGLNISSRKSLELMRTGDRWLIVKESVGS